MNRLTRRYPKFVDCNIDCCNFYKDCADQENRGCFGEILEKLARYEDLEEQGRLIILPPKEM